MPRRGQRTVQPGEKSVQIYAKFGDLVGPVETGRYEGWFPLESFQWGAGVGVSNGRWRRRNNNKPAPPPKRTASEPSFSEVTLSRTPDGTSALFMAAVGLHTCFDKTIVDMVDSDGLLVTRYTILETLISGYSSSGSATSAYESISLNFVAFECYSCSVLRTNLSIPPSLKESSSKETDGIPQPFAVADIAARIFHYLETPELCNAGLSCKLFLRYSSSPALKETIKNTVYVDLRDADRSVLNGLVHTADPNYVDQPEEDEDDM